MTMQDLKASVELLKQAPWGPGQLEYGMPERAQVLSKHVSLGPQTPLPMKQGTAGGRPEWSPLNCEAQFRDPS